MANKISLANKYRPQGFDAVVEQDSIKTILLNQMQTDNLKHAYLFCGSAGTGKTTSARIIANLMNNNEVKPIELDCASHNGVDDMRFILEDCKTKPVKGKYKIYLLDEVHMLTVQAWNSLLKVLEEPPEYVIFLFCTTDPQKIIGTVMSRVQRFNFQRISVDGIYNRLKYIVESENNERAMTDVPPIIYDEEALRYIARLARGGMRDSITTLEKCLDYNEHLTMDNVLKVTSGGVTEDTLLQLTRHILNGYCREALLHFNEIYMSGVDVSLFVKLYTEFLENCTKYLITLTPDITILSDETLQWLDEHKNALEPVNSMVDSILEIKTNYSSEDLKIIVESWIVRVCK